MSLVPEQVLISVVQEHQSKDTPTYTRTCTRTRTDAFTRMHTRAYACMYYAHIAFTRMHTRVRMHTRTYACTHTHTHTHILQWLFIGVGEHVLHKASSLSYAVRAGSVTSGSNSKHIARHEQYGPLLSRKNTTWVASWAIVFLTCLNGNEARTAWLGRSLSHLYSECVKVFNYPRSLPSGTCPCLRIPF